MLDRLGHADLLQVGHHGSNTSTTPALLEKVTPTYAVISVGKQNEGTNDKYCHPSKSTVDALTEAMGGRGRVSCASTMRRRRSANIKSRGTGGRPGERYAVEHRPRWRGRSHYSRRWGVCSRVTSRNQVHAPEQEPSLRPTILPAELWYRRLDRSFFIIKRRKHFARAAISGQCQREYTMAVTTLWTQRHEQSRDRHRT